MEAIAILLLGAAFGHALSMRLKIPPTPLLVLIGVALARSGLLASDVIEQTLVFGVTFLLFATGIELDPHRVRRQKQAALRVGAVQFFALAAIGWFAARVLGYDAYSSAWIALALTASSTLVLVRLLQRRRRLFEPAARLVVGVLLLQDMFVIGLVPVITRLPAGPESVIAGFAAVAVLGVLAWLVSRFGAPLFARLSTDDEHLLLVALATLFVFVGLATAMGLPAVVGAFLAGVSLARFPVNGVIRPQLQPVADFFSALFFTALGALVAPGPAELAAAVVLTIVVLVTTPPIVAAIAERYGFAARPALEAGLLLAQTSEISLVVGLFGVLAGQLDAGVFTVIALVTMFTMMLTPFVASDRAVWLLLRTHPGSRAATEPLAVDRHILLLGSGTTGMPLLETILAGGHEVVVVDDDPAVINRLVEADVPCIRGDAADPRVLRIARADRARIISSTIRRPEDNRILLEVAKNVPVIVRVFDEEDAVRVRAAGGIAVMYSAAAADGFLRWFDERFGGGSGPSTRSSPYP
jgi:Kef-type K+ transport system membrane component KefB